MQVASRCTMAFLLLVSIVTHQLEAKLLFPFGQQTGFLDSKMKDSGVRFKQFYHILDLSHLSMHNHIVFNMHCRAVGFILTYHDSCFISLLGFIALFSHSMK